MSETDLAIAETSGSGSDKRGAIDGAARRSDARFARSVPQR